MRRLRWLLLAIAVVACAQPTPPTAGPTPARTPMPSGADETRALLQVRATVREWCGSIGGCAYVAELGGPGGPWEAKFVSTSGASSDLVLGGGFPRSLPAGGYTLKLSIRALSDDMGNGVQVGTTVATCAAEFAVAPAQPRVVAETIFEVDSCAATVTG